MAGKIKWQYYFARKFSLQRFEIVMRVFYSDFFWKHFRIKLKNILVKPEQGGNHSIWLEEKEFSYFLDRIYKVVCQDLKHFYYYKRIIKQTQSRWVKAAAEVGRRVSQRLSNKELGKLYDKFIYYHQEHFNKPIWIPFPIEPTLSQAAVKVLENILRRNKKEDQYSYWFGIIFGPEESNAIISLQKELLKLALQVKERRIKKSNLDKKLIAISKQYCFIPCYDVIDKPWEIDYFRKELNLLVRRKLDELRDEYSKLDNIFIIRRNNFRKFLRDFKVSKKEKEILIMAHQLVFIKDERDDYRRRGCYLGRPLFAEIGRRLGLSLKEAAYLTIDETKLFLHRDELSTPISTIKERVKGYLLLRKEGRSTLVVSGKRINKVVQDELGGTSLSENKEVKGIVGAKGKAKGEVIIVRTKHDLRRVEEGQIMVAVTTNPDFVPAMRKCKAIVTNEGGITSHAAIVSRELGIPCIVGTKLATKVFKDGDLVEVDAEKGVVLKLK